MIPTIMKDKAVWEWWPVVGPNLNLHGSSLATPLLHSLGRNEGPLLLPLLPAPHDGGGVMMQHLATTDHTSCSQHKPHTSER